MNYVQEYVCNKKVKQMWRVMNLVTKRNVVTRELKLDKIFMNYLRIRSWLRLLKFKNSK